MIIRAEHSERQRELTPEALRRELTPEALRLRRVNKVFGLQSERSAASDNANRVRQLAAPRKSIFKNHQQRNGYFNAYYNQ